MALALCHPSRFAKTTDGRCGSCYDKDLRASNAGYRRRQRDNSTAWHRRNKDRVRATTLRRREKERANPLIRRNAMLKSKYGLDEAGYQRILSAQNGACAVCRRAPTNRPLHVDHDHGSGRVRGLLCHQCNWYLGTIDRDPTVLARIEAYRNI